MSGESVDKEYVKAHAGVYFYTYSVPQVVAVNLRLDAELGSAAKIYHHSVVHSDGNGRVETITAGPSEAGAWFKQLGFTPVLVQIAFLAHPDQSLVKINFDSTAWEHPEVKQAFIMSNWTVADFDYVKEFIVCSLEKISSVGYNLGGHNSNSFITLLWRQASQNAAASGRVDLDNPDLMLSGYFRPGSKYDLFESPRGYYADLIANWWTIAGRVGLGISKLGAVGARRLLVNRSRQTFSRGSKWMRKRRDGTWRWRR